MAPRAPYNSGPADAPAFNGPAGTAPLTLAVSRGIAAARGSGNANLAGKGIVEFPVALWDADAPLPGLSDVSVRYLPLQLLLK